MNSFEHIGAMLMGMMCIVIYLRPILLQTKNKLVHTNFTVASNKCNFTPPRDNHGAFTYLQYQQSVGLPWCLVHVRTKLSRLFDFYNVQSRVIK